MGKIISICAAIVLATTAALPAHASSKTVNLGSLASVTFNSTVTLKASGCQKIKFNYQLKKVSTQDTVVSISINTPDGELVGLADSYQSIKRIGSFTAKVCRKNWFNPDVVSDGSDGSQVNDGTMHAARKGKYEIEVLILDTSSFSTDTGYSSITFK